MVYNQIMKEIAVNKKAYYNYFISDEVEAGIVLEGSEVKSIRNGHISINESFVFVSNHEVYLKNAYIKQYDKASVFIPDERRTRKLLLNKAQIAKLEKKLTVSGTTIIPLKVYFKNNFAKVLIGIGKGKKLYDKRETIKQRTIERNLRNSY